MTTNRTLPIRVEPAPGEALDSWLEALSHRLRSAFCDTLVFLGLGTVSGLAISRSWLTRLTPHATEQLSVATGQPAQRIRQMTIAHLENANLLPHDDVRSDRRLQRWTHPRWSRYCPHCLAESGGRWQLQWRLGWIYACDKHHCLLVDACPRCGKGQRNRFFPGELIPAPGRCAQPQPEAVGRLAPRCGSELAAAPTTRFPDNSHPALTAQRLLHAAMTADRADFGIYRGHPVTATQLLYDIRALAGRYTPRTATRELERLLPEDLFDAYRHASHIRNVQSRPPARTPGVRARLPATTAAAAITAALRILDQPELADAGRALEHLDQRLKSNGKSLDWPITGWARRTSAAMIAARLTGRADHLTPSEQLRYRIGSPTPSIPSTQALRTTELARSIPATLWGDWALRLSAPSLDRAHLGETLSALVLLVNSRTTYRDAGKALGSRNLGRTTAHQLTKLTRDPHWPDIRMALIGLADYLHTNQAPIDYHRRRSLNYRSLLTENSWKTLCAQLDIRSGGEKRLRVVRCHLYSVISGNPPRRAPWFIPTNDFAAALFHFPAVLTPPLRAALDTETGNFLHHNGIEEPIAWSPPRRLTFALNLAGPNPDDISIRTLHRLVRQGQSLTDIADELGTTPEAVRHVLTITAAPESSFGPTSQPAPALSKLAAALNKEELADLYANQKLPLREIAERYGTSREVVARLARRYAIPLRPPHRHRHHDDVDPDWLYTEYVMHRRTLPDLAAEKGMSTANMSRWAKTHKIPLRGRGGPSHSATLAAQRSADHAPDIVKPALRAIGGWERLQRFSDASRYPNMTIAAQELGVDQFTLVNQINRVEDDLGKKLLERAERGRPMRLNADGAAVVRAVNTYASKRARMVPMPGVRTGLST